MRKTNFASYSINGIPEGCKRCIEGRKMVLFITGKCSRNCIYCPLSNLRKNSNKVWANERKCRNMREVIEEVRESNADSCSITGGDPLIELKKTVRYAKTLKKNFNNFHIHIYLSTKLVDEKNLKELSKTIDEVRFHPEFLSNPSKIKEDIEKIKLAKKFWEIKNIGVEMPVFPDRKIEILKFIEEISGAIGFVNLNELELGDTNFNFMIKKYTLNKKGYTALGSLEAGKWILKRLGKNKIKLKAHLCSAETKNWHQYRNRLKLHKIRKYEKRTKEGTVIYFATKNKEKLKGINTKNYYLDKKKNRFIINPRLVPVLKDKIKILRIEEFPTFDRDEVLVESI